MVQAKDDKKSSSRTVTRDAHWIEWLTGLLCTLIVATMILWIVYDAVTKTGSAPELRTRIIRQQSVSDGYRVSFTIENLGSRAATAVPVMGLLKDGEQVIETREVTFDYVPAQSSATGALLFRADPSTHLLEIHASGYADP